MRDVKISPASIVIALGVVLVLGAFGWLTFGPKPAPPLPAVLTPEARAYLSNLRLSNVHMQAAESYVNQRVVEIFGDIANAGDRNVKVIQVTCIFHDPSQQPVARESAFVLDGRSGHLAPGKSRSFRLAFDTIPESWDQALPSLVIAQIQFE